MSQMVFPHPLQPVAPDPEKMWLSEQGRAHTKAVNMAIDVQNVARSGKRVAPAMRTALRHQHARLSAALTALGGLPCREEAMTLMGRVNAWKESYDAIHWHAKRKSSGGERYICRLPAELKAAHYLLKRPLEKLLSTEGNIYGVKGRSRDYLAREIKDLQNEGFINMAVTDIVDCYQSVDPDAIYQLPLPKEVIRRTLDLRNQTLVEDHQGAQPQARFHDIVFPYSTTQKARGPRLEARGPKGLMQGSPLSGVILAWLLNGIPSREEARVYLCFDNLIVLARSPSETRAMIATLAAHFEQCSAGPLALCDPEYFDSKPADFLGYLFDPEQSVIGISFKERSKFLAKLNKAEADQAELYQEVLERHQEQRASSSLFDLHNPFRNHFPAEVWDILRSFRAGFPAASAEDPELQWLLENSRWLAERTKDGLTMFLHDHLFEDRNSEISQQIRAIIKHFNEGLRDRDFLYNE